MVVGHSYALGGFADGTDPLYRFTRTQESFGGFAVAAFFIISGFLITRSWTSHPTVGRFLWHRVLRIFPAFWICLLVTAFVFAPFAWRIEHGRFSGFFDGAGGSALDYVWRNAGLVINQFEIDGLLAGTPHPGAWNGSLWTLAYEFGCYLVVAVLGAIGILARHRRLVVAMTVLAYVVTIVGLVDASLPGRVVPVLADPWIARFLFLFGMGAVFALFADRIEMSWRIALLAGLLVVATMWKGGWIAVGYPALAYLLIWLAARLPFTTFDRPGDFSYGTYIYAFPIQMLLADLAFQRHGLVAFALASLGLTTVAAVISWHLVEKHALRLKKWTPRPLRRRER